MLANRPRGLAIGALVDTKTGSNWVVVPKGRFELPRPQGALRPERSASAIPPLRHILGLRPCPVALLMVGDILTRRHDLPDDNRDALPPELTYDSQGTFHIAWAFPCLNLSLTGPSF